MEFLMLCLILYIVFISVCVSIVCLTDSDILTFLALHFGRAPKSAFSGKVVWITGASSGIGEAIAKELALIGAKMIISARRKDELERVKKECLALNKELSDADVLILPFDMLEIPSHEPSFLKALKHFGKIDVLVSNAGRSQRAMWQEIKLEVDREVFELNFFSLVSLNRILVKYFLETGQGHVVINSSLAGKVCPPYSASYTASKHALHGYFNSLRNEVRFNNIDVTILCPGPTFTGFLSEAFTAETGKKFGVKAKSTDRRMTAERCALLSVVAMANKIQEAWIGIFPSVTLVYLNYYLPYIAEKLEYLLCSSGAFMKMRDGGRETMKED